jgi:hypothetical protein
MTTKTAPGSGERVGRLLKLMAACALISMVIGCGTTRVVDRKFQPEKKYTPAEAVEILRTALLKGAITDLNLTQEGFSYKLALTRFGGPMPFSKATITFAEITKVTSTRGPRGDFFYLYKTVKGKEEVCFEGLSGRDDAFADQVASALFVLCPNLK